MFVDSDGIVEKVSPGAYEIKPNVGPYFGDWWAVVADLISTTQHTRTHNMQAPVLPCHRERRGEKK